MYFKWKFMATRDLANQLLLASIRSIELAVMQDPLGQGRTKRIPQINKCMFTKYKKKICLKFCRTFYENIAQDFRKKQLIRAFQEREERK